MTANNFIPGIDLKKVDHLKYGRELHFWYFEKKSVKNMIYPGGDGLVRLGGNFHHIPGPLMPSTSSSIDALIIMPAPYFACTEDL